MHDLNLDEEEAPSWEELYDIFLGHIRDMPPDLARKLGAQVLAENPVPRRRLPSLTLINCEESCGMIELTEEQKRALDKLWARDVAAVADDEQSLPTWPTKDAMLASVQPGPGCVMIYWAGMWLGIEPDGYTHS